MARRAQGLALNTIIIAILVVVVLVVVILLFVGTMSNTGKAITQSTPSVGTKCVSAGGQCVPPSLCPYDYTGQENNNDCGENTICCIPPST